MHNKESRSIMQCYDFSGTDQCRCACIEHTRNFFGEAEIYDDFHPGDDPSEIFGVREFRAGDKMQSIHWKLSAKSDDLLVRENSQPKACPLVFLLEPPNSKKKWKKKN